MTTPKIVEEIRAELPPLRFSDEVLRRIGKIGEGAILENILRQKQADGSPIERNKKSTRDLKVRKNWLWRGRVMSLIAEKKRFVKGQGQSFRSRVQANHAVIEPAPGDIKNLSKWVQEGGEGRNQYVGWFGLSDKARGAVRAELRRWIKEEFSRVPRKR